ncbi:small oligopeptide transporter, OPT family [Aspergillus glaucus CBS 516.65]|uniref:Uncharacterized protein n=1 Tax=Aspergillus glaucus CBS 516.65 TaxID=1160497 RepID=A0A1L9VQR3_ASPGL|nr:hypothetical protein ASPGLDRAFT_24370 [Aspergillus glaucus CBS 516.65]OJJ86242.1 hypothetical protein ASPGLDRAFT_24370 [Aspergillus glaucus CBS 516.65]
MCRIQMILYCLSTCFGCDFGVVFTLVGTGVSQFFSMRYPSMAITSFVAQLISYPVGYFFAKALPIMKASAIIHAQKVYLKMETLVGYQILLALSMQMFGLGLAGLA